MIATVTAWSVIFFLICVMILLWTAVKRRAVFNILMVAFFLRFAFAVYVVISSGGNYYDADGLVGRAEAFSNMGFFSLLQAIPFTAYLYSWVVGVVWHVIGAQDIMLASLFNALLSFLCCVVAYDLSAKLFTKKTARVILVIVAVFPTLLLESAGYANRESLFILPFLMSLRFVYEYYSKGNLSKLLWSVLFAIIASIVHTVGIALFVLILVVSLKVEKGRYRQVLRIVLPIFLLVLIAGLFSSGIGTEKFYNSGSGVELAGSIQDSRATGRAAYLQGIQINTAGDMLVYSPIKILYFIMAPFAWMVRSVSDIYGMLDGLVYLVIFIAIYKSGVLKKDSQYSRFLKYVALTAILMITILAFGTANYGTAMRHRAKIFIPLVIVTGVYIERRNTNKKNKGVTV